VPQRSVVNRLGISHCLESCHPEKCHINVIYSPVTCFYQTNIPFTRCISALPVNLPSRNLHYVYLTHFVYGIYLTLFRNAHILLIFCAGRQRALVMRSQAICASSGGKSHGHMVTVELSVQSSARICHQRLWVVGFVW